jgi:hypothetical protein
VRVVTAPDPTAKRAGTIVYIVVLTPITLLLAIVTLLLLLALVTDPAGSAPQIPAILIGLVMTTAGGLSIYFKLRRLVRGG